MLILLGGQVIYKARWIPSGQSLVESHHDGSASTLPAGTRPANNH